MSDLEKNCDDFENAYRETLDAGQRGPSIEEYLEGFSGEERDRLLRELLLLEWEFNGVCEREQIEPYLQRFPEATSVVEQAFQKHIEMLKDAESVQASVPDSPPEMVGTRFEVLKFHRAGGLGKVWIARDQEVDREVALKEIKSEYADHPALRRRFVVEAEVTGKLEHPGVVPVYGFGQRADGRPFYAMRFIRGDSLLDAINQFHDRLRRTATRLAQSTELRSLLRRFVDVCRTLDYAHSRSVVHRDLKPDNIMLGPFGETLVVDWGLATITQSTTLAAPESQADADVAAETDVEEGPRVGPLPISTGGLLTTRRDRAVGTPAYMSPEQAGAESGGVSRASDIYSLGATLYHLLAGKPPVTGKSLYELMECVKTGKFIRPRSVNKGIPRSLEAVCLKAMALRPQDRYQTAGQLAAEIDRWLDDEPVQARRETWWEVFGRWMRRNRTPVGVGLISLVLIATLTSVSALIINSLRKKEIEARVLAEENAERARRGVYAAQLFSVGQLVNRDPGRSLELLNNLNACPEDLRCFCWAHYYRTCRRDRIRWQAHPPNRQGGKSHLAGFSADGQLISVGADGAIKFWNVDDRTLSMEVPTGGPIAHCVLDPSRSLLATVSPEGPIRLWNASTGKSKGSFSEEAGSVLDLAFTPDGSRLVSLQRTPTGTEVLAWMLSSKKPIDRFGGPPGARVIAISPDGKRMAVGGSAAGDASAANTSGDERLVEVALLRLADGAPLAVWQDDPLKAEFDDSVCCLAFVDEESLLLCSSGGALIALDASEEDRLVARDMTVAHNGSIRALAIHVSDATALAVTAGMGTGAFLDLAIPHQPVVLWDARSLAREYYLAGIVGEVTDVLLDPTGFVLVALSGDGKIGVHEIGPEWTWGQLGHRGPVEALAFDEEGTTLSALVMNPQTNAATVRQWDVKTRQPREPTRLPDGENDAWWFPSRISSGGIWLPSNGDSIRVRDPLDGTELGRLTLKRKEHLAAVSPDGRFAAITDHAHTLVVREMYTDSTVASLHVDLGRGISAVAFSHSGKVLAWVDQQNRLQIWNLHEAKPISQSLETDSIVTMAFSPDDAILAISTGVKTEGGTSSPPVLTKSGNRRTHPSSVILWHLPSGDRQTVLEGHAGAVEAIAFSPDGKTLATGGLDWDVKLWNPTSGTQVASAPHVGPVTAIAFSPDGRTLATASRDQSVKLWLSATPEMVVEREATRLVELLQDTIPLKSEMLKRAGTAKHITETVRHRALSKLQGFEEDPEWLNQWSWDVLRLPRRSQTDYGLALQSAKTANRLRPNDPAILNTLGAAFYRNKQIDDAIETLINSSKLAQKKFGTHQPADLAFLAMSYARVGQMERARQHQEQFLQTIRNIDPQQGAGAVAEFAALWEEVSALVENQSVH